MNKKVLIITYYWPPAGGAGVQRWLKMAKYLPEYGITPIILTVNENYANYPQIDKGLINDVDNKFEVSKTKTFEFYNLYKKLTNSKELPYGGFVNEEKKTLLKKIGRFVRGNFFIPDPRKGWNKYAYNEALKIIEKHNIDTVITTSPPHSTQLIGLKLKNIININWIADLRDPWVDLYYNNQFYKTNIANKIDSNYERSVIETSDKVLVVSNSIRNNFAEKYKESSSKIKVLTNGYDPDDITQKTNNELYTDKLLITYTGTISEIYPMNTFIDAVKSIIKVNANILIRLVGNVHQSFKAKIINDGLKDYFEFVGQVSHSKSIKYLQASNISLLLIPMLDDNKGILTGKFFEYLGVKKTILAIGPVDSDVAIVLEETDSGNIFEYSDIEGISNFVKKQKQSFSFINIEKYSRKTLTRELVNYINI